jgi:hypothetical protein
MKNDMVSNYEFTIFSISELYILNPAVSFFANS